MLWIVPHLAMCRISRTRIDIVGKICQSSDMSDGPHRNLPLKRRWKKVAEVAGTPAFSLDEVCDEIGSALSVDYKQYVSRRLRSEMQSLESPNISFLFPESKLELLRQRRDTEAGCVLGTLILDNLERRMRQTESSANRS